jgi:hypothetical protein
MYRLFWIGKAGFARGLYIRLVCEAHSPAVNDLTDWILSKQYVRAVNVTEQWSYLAPGPEDYN